MKRHARPLNRTRGQILEVLGMILFLLELVAIVVLIPALGGVPSPR